MVVRAILLAAEKTWARPWILAMVAIRLPSYRMMGAKMGARAKTLAMAMAAMAKAKVIPGAVARVALMVEMVKAKVMTVAIPGMVARAIPGMVAKARAIPGTVARARAIPGTV